VARLELDIDVVDGGADGDGDGLHVTGRLRDEFGFDQPFVGWVGLLAILQQAVTQT
jgi:hypothetical protein